MPNFAQLLSAGMIKPRRRTAGAREEPGDVAWTSTLIIARAGESGEDDFLITDHLADRRQTTPRSPRFPPLCPNQPKRPNEALQSRCHRYHLRHDAVQTALGALESTQAL